MMKDPIICFNINLDLFVLLFSQAVVQLRKARWRMGLECCQLKGKVLLSYPLLHPDMLTPTFTDSFVSANDIVQERRWEWVTGEVMSHGRPLFTNNIQPNNMDSKGNEQHCGVVINNLRIDDRGCLGSYRFLCEDLPVLTEGEPTAEERETCRNIEYEELVDGYLVQKNIPNFVTLNKPAAAACCRVKGWQLASLKDLSSSTEAVLAKKMGPGSYWTSGSKLGNSQTFIWGVKTDVIEAKSRFWCPTCPQSLYGTRNCVQTYAGNNNTVVVRDVACQTKQGIICQTPPCKPQVCIATDTVDIVYSVEKNQFEFKASPTLAEQVELGVSLLRHLSPSSVTNLNWSVVWQKFYLDNKGKWPVKFSSSGKLPPQPDKCMTSFNVWLKYVTKCADIEVIYIEGPKIVTSENITNLCPKLKNCSLCRAADSWQLISTHETFNLTSKVNRVGRVVVHKEMLQPCLIFEPPLDPYNAENGLLYREFTATLSPSPNTGVNWMHYFQNVTQGIAPQAYEIKKGDVPPGSFTNVYGIVGICGNRSTAIPVYKLVLFKRGDTGGNCAIANSEGVPLEGC